MIDITIRILIIEDEITDAVLLQRQLNKIFSKADIRVSDTLLSARYTAKTFLPELIFSDFQLVGFTGEDVIINLKEIFPHIPIILISGTLNDEELAASTILRGASAFFQKKNMNELHERLEPALVKILDETEQQRQKLARRKHNQEKLNRIHTIIKEASHIDHKNSDAKLVAYYKNIFNKLKDNVDTIFS